MLSKHQTNSANTDSLKNQYTLMEQSAMIVQTAWQNALYTNPIDYSDNLSLQKLLNHFHTIHRENF